MPDPEVQNPIVVDPAAAGGQNQPEVAEWIGSLDPELRTSPSAAKFKGKTWGEVGPTLFKSYVNLEKFQIPGEGAGPEEIKKFNERLGVPETPEKYEYKATPPPGVPWDGELEGEFKKIAHGAGLTPRQHKAIVDGWTKLIGTGADRLTENTGKSLSDAHASLKTKWAGNYERNVGLVQRTVADIGIDGFGEMLDTIVIGDTKLGNHPVMLQHLKELGESRLEAGLISGDNLLLKSNDAQAEVDKLMAPGQPYWKGDKAAIKKVAELMAIIHPSNT